MTKGFSPLDVKKTLTSDELIEVFLAEVDKEKGNPDPRAKEYVLDCHRMADEARAALDELDLVEGGDEKA
jgi:hypothetical protein